MSVSTEPAQFTLPATAARRRLETWILIIPMLILALVGGNISMAALPAHIAFVAMALVATAIILIGVYRPKSADGRHIPLNNPLDFSGALLIFLTVLSTHAYDQRRSTEFWLFPLALQFPYFYLVVALQRRDWAVISWLRAIFIVVGGLCIEALITSIGFYGQIAGLHPPSQDMVPIPFRLYSVLNNPNVFGVLLAMSIPAAIGYFFWTNRRWERIAAGALLAGMGWALLATGSRGSQLAAVAGVAVGISGIGVARGWYRFLMYSRRVQISVAALIGFTIVVIGGVLLIESRSAGRSGSEARHFDLWQTAIHAGVSNALGGIGPGGFSTAQLRTVSAPPTPVERHAHNLFLNFFAENGVPGLSALLLWSFVLIGATRRAWKAFNTINRAWLSGLAGGIVAFGVAGLLDDPMAQMAPLSLLVLFTALIASAIPHPGWRSYTGPFAPWVALIGAVVISATAVAFTIRYATLWNAAQSSPNNSEQTWTDTAVTLDLAAVVDSSDALTWAQAAVAWVQVTSSARGEPQSAALNKAIVDYQHVVQLDPAFAVHHLNLGALLLQRGSLDEAIAEFATAVQRAPASGITHLNYAVALEQANRNDLAVAEYKQALAYGVAHSPLFWQATAIRQSVPAVPLTTTAVDDTPHALASGLAALKRGDTEGARYEFTAAITLGGGDAATAALFALGDLDSALGDQTGALEQFRSAFTRIDRYGVLGPGHTGDQSYAVNAFNRFAYISDYVPAVLTLDITPDRADRLITLAKAMASAGDYRAAAHIYQRILRDDPGDRAAEIGLAQLGNVSSAR